MNLQVSSLVGEVALGQAFSRRTSIVQARPGHEYSINVDRFSPGWFLFTPSAEATKGHSEYVKYVETRQGSGNFASAVGGGRCASSSPCHCGDEVDNNKTAPFTLILQEDEVDGLRSLRPLSLVGMWSRESEEELCQV